MDNFELKAIVTKSNIRLVDINGFKYNLTEVNVSNMNDFKVLIPIFSNVTEGDCIVSTDWVITRLRGVEPVEIVLRVNKLDIVDNKNFQISKYLISKCYGRFVATSNCALKTVGPERKPFYMATLKIEDECKDLFAVSLVGFKDIALRLSNTKRASYISAIVCIKKKAYITGYELCVQKFKVIKEGNNKVIEEDIVQ